MSIEDHTQCISGVEEVTSEKSKYDSPVCEYRVIRKRESDLAKFLTKNYDQIKNIIPHFVSKYYNYGGCPYQF